MTEELYAKADSGGSDTKGEAITVTAVGDENKTDICIKIDVSIFTKTTTYLLFWM